MKNFIDFMRRKFVAGNWKMNTTLEEGKELLESLMNADLTTEAEIVVCPPFTHLATLGKMIENEGFIFIGAQNCAKFEQGAYTGEVSAAMLKELVSFVIIGHSERRQYFNESNADIKAKLDLLIQHHLSPIFCCGESLETRKENRHIEFVLNQIEESVFHLNHVDAEKVVIAYEPIWAIGTGMTAGPEEAQEMHEAIRNGLNKRYGADTADNVSIIYGGSCNASNAKALFAQKDIDGGLIGGASLKAAEFIRIIQSF